MLKPIPFLLAILSVVLFVAPLPRQLPIVRPDIVVLIFDDVGEFDLNRTSVVNWTPNIASVAARGVRHRRAYSHSKCAPTRDSFYFGQWLGLDRGDACAPPIGISHHPKDFSLPKVFAGQGYATCHIGKHHTGALAVGQWETSLEAMGFGSVRATTPVGPTCNDIGGDGALQPQLNDGQFTQSSIDSSVRCRDAFSTWWAENAGRPRFAVVEFGSAHTPFRYPPPSLLPPGYPHCGLPCQNRQEYEAEIVGLDTVVGTVIDAVGPNAYIVIFGDNGTPGIVPGEPQGVTDATAPGQDPLRVKLSAYEGGVHVPLIIAGPGVKPGESDALVHVGVDMIPTLAQMAGFSPLTKHDSGLGIHGRSFAGTLLGLPGPRVDGIFVWNPPPNLDSAVIERRWKLLTTSTGAEELYDLENDPGETTPLQQGDPDFADNYTRLAARRAVILAGGS